MNTPPSSERPSVPNPQRSTHRSEGIRRTEQVVKESIAGVQVTRNADLQYTHYSATDQRFDVYLSDDARRLGLSFSQLKRLTQAEVSRIKADSLGATNIDPERSEESGRRTINRLTDEVQAQIGEPIVIKGGGVPTESQTAEELADAEDLIEQYLVMRDLSLSSTQHRSEQERQVLDYAKVYGVVQMDGQQFLIEQMGVDAQRIVTHGVKIPPFTYVSPAPEGFSPTEYPDLATIVPDDLRAEGDDIPQVIPMNNLARYLGSQTGLVPGDLDDRNVLKQTPGVFPQYLIIDQDRAKPPETKTA